MKQATDALQESSGKLQGFSFLKIIVTSRMSTAGRYTATVKAPVERKSYAPERLSTDRANPYK
jgi:hypothetical protein